MRKTLGRRQYPATASRAIQVAEGRAGIDGIYEAHDGSHVAYQVKYRQKQQLTFAEVAPFLGITEQFSDRVIFTNAARLSHKAHVRTRWVSADVFRNLSFDVLRGIEAWIKLKPIPVTREKPDPSYQVQALADIRETLAKHDRATAVMACGRGKTLVALWAAEQEAPKTVLVLVPSLTLLQQTLREWSEQTKWGNSFGYLCVCSDSTVGLKGDDLNVDKAEVGFRIDTDPDNVRQFLERQTTDIKVIFSTYQSSPVVGEGARGLPPFDFAIFDEAHKTIGLAGSAFGYALSDENIRIKKRLFLTATPRHIDIRHRDKEGEFRIHSMDDETAYGPRAHTLSFGTAAQKGIICRYKVYLAVADIAPLLGVADQLLDGGGGKVEQWAVGLGLGTPLLQHLFLLRHHLDLACHEFPQSALSRRRRWKKVSGTGYDCSEIRSEGGARSRLFRGPPGSSEASSAADPRAAAFCDKLAGAADGLRLFPHSPLGGFFVVAAKFHLAEDPLALHLLLQHLEGLIDIVVTDENLHAAFLFIER